MKYSESNHVYDQNLRCVRCGIGSEYGQQKGYRNCLGPELRAAKPQANTLDEIKKAFFNKEAGNNSMGNSENLYNPYYLIKTCFELEELEVMSDKELDNLLKLADHASDAFY